MDGIINFKSLENVLFLFDTNLLNQITILVYDFVTWYSPNMRREEGTI